jgi:photosystem II stability/assembly factor-like uncharacterized protein
MPHTVPSSGKTRPASAATKFGQRRAKAEQRAALARRAAQRRPWARWGAVIAVVLVVVAGISVITTGGNDAGKPSPAAPEVGGDLHTVTMIGDALYVGGHEAVAVSHDGGRRWQPVDSLKGADAMGWALTPDALLVGGHPGLFRSADNGASFAKVTGSAAVPDVHALGGAGTTVYLGSPQAGLLASEDGGNTWQVRNAQAGRSMMGSILVDPKDPTRLIAPDMSAGLTASSDGGRTWKPMGGPSRVMAAAWNPTDTRQIIAAGMSGGARTNDGGGTWQQIQLPVGTSAVTYDASGSTVYAGVLDGQRARVYRSTDGGATWTATA